ncbi:Cell wall protein RBR3, partial [Candida parapsilosis]
GDSLTTITTFPQPTQTEYTTTWTTTKDDGSVETDSGIVSQSGDSLTTITTFPQPTQTEYTTTWTTTKDDGSVETDS